MSTEEINIALKEIVARATLPQAIRISMQYLREYYPKLSSDELYHKIYFRANPSLAFQKSDLSAAVLKRNSEGMFIELTLNFLAVFGSSSPLPSHYSEMILQSSDSDNVLRDYLDIYNHHLQKLVYPIWMKYRYYIHYQHDLKDTFSKYMLSLLGLYHEHNTKTSRLNLQKLMPYLGILSMRQKSSGMLLPILKHYLSHEAIEIEQCITHTIAIPSWQHCNLGSANCTLGSDFLAGESIKSKNNKFRIVLKSAQWEDLIAYSVHGTKMDKVNDLIDFMLQEPLIYDVALHVQNDQIIPCELSNPQCGYLGINSVIGTPQENLEVLFTYQGDK